jgi:hypothetical protein
MRTTRIPRDGLFAALLQLIGVGACDRPAAELTKADRETSFPVDSPHAQQLGGGVAPPVGQRWVLRDADGDPVNAIVEPMCDGPGADCAIPSIGQVGGIASKCARVIWLGDQYVNMAYALASGTPQDCNPSSPGLVSALYLDDSCAGQPYAGAGAGVQDAHRFTRHVAFWEDADALYYETADAAIAPQPYYYWNNSGDTCLYDAFNNGLYFRAWAPVPDWAITALAEPPYSLSWE